MFSLRIKYLYTEKSDIEQSFHAWDVTTCSPYGRLQILNLQTDDMIFSPYGRLRILGWQTEH